MNKKAAFIENFLFFATKKKELKDFKDKKR